ncbi:MAG: twitching motility protein PilT [Thiothrix lacustris]|uniref:Twitching motility protein PilT n=1 Tax=Thiothrix lacustris TaxID=525917 RepID=A0A1Y1QEQ1_9GAMM|nr:MAG: twitching motility protein PilT [Thiothrix lacustris]
MRLLLDTHTFLWWDAQEDKLPPAVLALCQDTQHELFLSVASIWEMQIKHNLGKLALHLPLEKLVLDQVQKNALQILPIQMNHVLGLSALPDVHKDPFDRLLIAQANVEKMTLLSGDGVFKNYPVQLFW